MNKRFVPYVLVAVIVSALAVPLVYIRQNQSQTKMETSLVIQEKQAVAPQETVSTSSEIRIVSTTTEAVASQGQSPKKEPPTAQQESQAQTSVMQKVADTAAYITYAVSSFFVPERGDANENAIPPTSYIANTPNAETPYGQLPPLDFAGQKYIVVDGNIVTADNKVIYNIPPDVYSDASGGNGWTNTVVSVTAIGTVPPVIGAIPVLNLPGKFYLSTNSFGDMEQCQFSNKIFILDTIANTTTLIYEENNTTLTRDDPRACNSEIFLLATDEEKLVLKYHTIGTNTLCDSAWSEPEKTFYIDVTKLQTEGMKKYAIPATLSSGAEQEEEACRGMLSATGTQP